MQAAALPRARRRALYVAAGAAALAYYAHRARWLARTRAALAPLAEAAAAYRDAAKTSGLVASRLSADISAFLAHDGAEVPVSLKQLLRLVQSAEAQAAVATLGSSLSRGVASGVAAAAAGASAEPLAAGRRLLEAALEEATSERGRSVIACIAGAAARHAVVAALEMADQQRASGASGGGAPDADTMERVLTELDTDRGRRVATGARRGGVTRAQQGFNSRACSGARRTLRAPRRTRATPARASRRCTRFRARLLLRRAARRPQHR
jgi:hypothetical protein